MCPRNITKSTAFLKKKLDFHPRKSDFPRLINIVEGLLREHMKKLYKLLNKFSTRVNMLLHKDLCGTPVESIYSSPGMLGSYIETI